MGERLRVFARRPAPVQVTHFNYPDTTGLPAMDRRITDWLAEPHEGPDGDDRFSVERLYRMPQCAWCYDPGVEVPDVGPLPASRNGYVTFALMNKPLKHTPQAAQLSSASLKAVPGLEAAASRVQRLLGKRPFGRAVRRPRRPGPPHVRAQLLPLAVLELHNAVDIALDPFPYNGGITSADGLYMGVPLVTLAGKSYLSRQGVMLLTNLNLPELIASDADEYVRIAASLARNLPLLASLRHGLRERMRHSPIMDGRQFAANLGAAYRTMWDEWCTNDYSSHLMVHDPAGECALAHAI